MPASPASLVTLAAQSGWKQTGRYEVLRLCGSLLEAWHEVDPVFWTTL